MKHRLVSSLGVFFIALGTLLNKWTITAVFSPDGEIKSVSILSRIWACEGWFLLIGILLIIYRKRIGFHLRQWVVTGLGLLFMTAGIAVNEWVVAAIFLVEGHAIRMQVWLLDVLLILIGGLIIRYRDRVSFRFLTTSYALVFFSTSFAVIGAEVVLRLAGYRPYVVSFYNIRVEPGGKMYQPHATLGYSHIPGQYRVTILPDNLTFTLTHLPNTLRITHPLITYPADPQKKEIWIFGCSFTHGWGLNDQETFAWLLQEKLAAYEIVNFGVDGYGTLHSLIQFREALEKGKPPQVAILTYASFHDERNTFLRTRRKTISTFNRLGSLLQPYARFDGQGNLHYSMATVMYREFPLMRYSAFSHLLENTYDRVEQRFAKSHEVSKALVKDFLTIAKLHDVKFVVAGIVSDELTADMLKYCQQEGMMTVDISVDLTAQKYMLSASDSHPNAIANVEYAQKIEHFLFNLKE